MALPATHPTVTIKCLQVECLVGGGGVAVCLKLLWLRPIHLDHLTFSSKSPEYLEE